MCSKAFTVLIRFFHPLVVVKNNLWVTDVCLNRTMYQLSKSVIRKCLLWFKKWKFERVTTNGIKAVSWIIQYNKTAINFFYWFVEFLLQITEIPVTCLVLCSSFIFDVIPFFLLMNIVYEDNWQCSHKFPQFCIFIPFMSCWKLLKH